MLGVEIYYNLTNPGQDYSPEDLVEKVFSFQVDVDLAPSLTGEHFVNWLHQEFSGGQGSLPYLLWMSGKKRTLKRGDLLFVESNGIGLWWILRPTGWGFNSHLEPNIAIVE